VAEGRVRVMVSCHDDSLISNNYAMMLKKQGGQTIYLLLVHNNLHD